MKFIKYNLFQGNDKDGKKPTYGDDEAVVTMTQEIGDEVLTKLIEDEDYKVIEISVE